MQEAADLTAARAAIAAVRDRFVTASDEELLADTALLEEAGRMIDGLRAKAAWQLEHRSRPLLGTERLSFKTGARDGVELVQLTTGVSRQEASRRVGIGTALAPVTMLGVETGPGIHGAIADAVLNGEVGIGAARMLVNLWKDAHVRAEPTALEQAMGELLDLARLTDEQGLLQPIAQYAEALDPDGAEPRERRQHRNRSFKLGATRADGTTAASMILTPEDLAFLKELLQSRRRGVQLIRTEPGSDATDDSLGPEWRNPTGCDPTAQDAKSRAQEDYDTLVGSWRLAAKAEAQGFTPTTTTHQVVITVTAAEVQARKGLGWTPGVMAGLPMPVIEQTVCDGSTRLQVLGPKGETLFLSRESRLFSPAQKIALTVAADGRCQYPGCDVPAPYLEAHHAEWWTRDDGKTDIDNGILLCSYHHHLFHAANSPIEIRKHDGDLYIVPRTWIGDPMPEQRRQGNPITDSHRVRRRRRRRPSPRTERPPATSEP